MSKHSKTLISACLSVLLFLGCMPGSASAVTQADIDSARAWRDAIRAERQEKQALVDSLVRQQAGVVQQKAAMDERSDATLRQIQATEDEIRLYEDLVAQKAAEAAVAKALEDEQLVRYRKRVRAMEEEGRLSLLGVLLCTADLRELLTVMDDVAEIMRYDRELEDAYIAARRHTEELRTSYEIARDEQQHRRFELQNEERELRAEIDEAAALIESLQTDIENRQAEADAVLAAAVRKKRGRRLLAGKKRDDSRKRKDGGRKSPARRSNFLSRRPVLSFGPFPGTAM